MALDSKASQAQISDAIWSNLAGFCQCFGSTDGGECGIDPDVKWTRSGRQVFNSIVRANFAPGAARHRVAEITEMVRSWNAPVTWRVCSDDRPDDLVELLLAQGWQNPRAPDQPVTFAGMALSLDAPAVEVPRPDGLSIARATREEDLCSWPRIFFDAASEEDLEEYADILSKLALSDPQSRIHYTAYMKGEPVASCMLYIDSGVAGLYAIGTIPEARGQGVGTAITHYALQQARDMGHKWAILQATDMGAGIYRRLGFKDYGSVRILIFRP